MLSFACMQAKLLQLCLTLCNPIDRGAARQEYWSGLPCPLQMFPYSWTLIQSEEDLCKKGKRCQGCVQTEKRPDGDPGKWHPTSQRETPQKKSTIPTP